MKTLQHKIDEGLKLPTVEEAVSHIFMDEALIKKGATVAVLDDPIYGFNGLKGKVGGPSMKGGGFVDVTFENGVTVPLQVTLLCPL